jgi:hypothetical protein
MARCLSFMICLLLSLSAGFATYTVGAIAWCVIDPQGAGAKLLFTIPIALAGMAVPGIIGLLCAAFRCEFTTDPKPVKQRAALPERVRPMRTPQPALATPTAPAAPVDQELELAFAT